MRFFLVLLVIVSIYVTFIVAARNKANGIQVHRGRCPVYPIKCMIGCLTTTIDNCKNAKPPCCTSDENCPKKQKCCEPVCGCWKVCTDVAT
ncbi:unnamed protein product [Rotaria magnacalcarata]|uniref:WAP domain-containing protein n=1 Tax=Rotaria magnacalcarata TaxID=392030 RepID=A0A815FUG9_9BILA|nr:unnamed protein product [Rotaria magnacalcarata]CAF2071360.1 unnamed protein product [Rotaria magnacalcarata]